jgi:hypothetical protein
MMVAQQGAGARRARRAELGQMIELPDSSAEIVRKIRVLRK